MKSRLIMGVLLAVTTLMMAVTVAQGAPPQAKAPAAVSKTTPVEVTNTLRALSKLKSFGYSISTPKQADRSIRHWQKVNGLVVDGIVGPQTIASLDLSAQPTVPAVRLNPPTPAPEPQVGNDPASIIRDVWPDELEDHAIAIAKRESNLQPEVINRNRNATGLFQIMWTVHRGWLCPQLGICAQSDLQDARNNATAAYALYQRAGGWGPWNL
jgi:lipoprotein-anchoring transpeptidase ErfK/SrfK